MTKERWLDINETELNRKSLGVFEETATLKKVLMWGAPGAETILGQLLPKKLSCFEAEFNVLEARDEFNKAKAIIKNHGVEIIQVKDLFAEMVEDKGLRAEMGLDCLRQKIKNRAYSYYEKYKNDGISDVEEVLSWLDEVLISDKNKYGENAATYMNEILSLKNELPLANVLYARDQSNLLASTFIWSSMRYCIRQPEVHLFKTVLSHSGILENSGITQVQVNGKNRFEGGDGIATGGIVYIGVGGRSNMGGILQAAESIVGNGGRLMVPIDEERDRGDRPEMDAMHLDTIWMPSDKNEVVACETEVERRKLLEIVSENGKLVIKNRGWFADHLAKLGTTIIPLTKEEQEKYAPNFLNLGNKTVVLSLDEGNKLTEHLKKHGKKVYNANLKNITKGYGGLHCMTASIVREK